MKLLSLILLISSMAVAEEPPVNQEVVKQLEVALQSAKEGKLYQIFLVTTGKDGIGYSFSTTEQGELILVGGVDWAKTVLIKNFDDRQNKAKAKAKAKVKKK